MHVISHGNLMDLIETNVHTWDTDTIMPKLNSERGKKWFWQVTGWVVVMHLGCLEIFCELCQSWHLALVKCYSFQGFSLFTQTLYFMKFFWRTLHMAWVRTVGAFLRTLFVIYPPLPKTMETYARHLGKLLKFTLTSTLGEVQRVRMGWLNPAQTLGISLSSAVHRDNGQPLAWIYKTPAFSVLTFANERAEYSW